VRLLLSCTCNNENVEGYDRAVVDLTPELTELIQFRFRVFLEAAQTERLGSPEASLHEIRFVDPRLGPVTQRTALPGRRRTPACPACH
jgi:hypothetical protein